jgi:hypothetical protein
MRDAMCNADTLIAKSETEAKMMADAQAQTDAIMRGHRPRKAALDQTERRLMPERRRRRSY